MAKSLAQIVILLVAFLISGIKCEPAAGIPRDSSSSSSAEASAAAAAIAAASGAEHGGPLPPPMVPPGIPPILPGAGAGFGVHKSLDFNIGKGIGLGGLGGLGGLEGLGGLAGLIPGMGGLGGEPGIPPPIEGGLGGGLGGGYMGLPYFLGPQYIPQSWIGSALAAKGDLFFPIVIFLFAIAGIFTVVKFLLALLVPLVAKKFAIASVLSKKKGGQFVRSIPDQRADHQARVDELTHHIVPFTEEEDDEDE